MNFKKIFVAFNSFLERMWECLRNSADRQFGVIFSGVFLIIGLFLWNKENSAYLACWSLSLIFFVLAIVAPQMLHHLNLIWIRFGEILQIFISPVIMLMIYFFFLTPYGLLMKLLGHRGQLKINKHDRCSYWIDRADPLEDSSFKNQF